MSLQTHTEKTASTKKTACRARAAGGNRPLSRTASGVWWRRQVKLASGKSLYNYFRDYDPATGRYVQSDPIGLRASPNTYAYALSRPLEFSDPLGLDVQVCSQPAFGWFPLSHQWIRTSTVEAGMGGTRGNEAGNDSGDSPGDRVQVTDHRGRSKQKGAQCEEVKDVDENKVNDQLIIGRNLGRWGPTNQCQSFVAQVLGPPPDAADKPYFGHPNLGRRKK